VATGESRVRRLWRNGEATFENSESEFLQTWETGS
jgi:hypothetical protein